MYNPMLGRWFSVDPLDKKYPFSSPYIFVLNTPIWAFDPDGRLTIYASGACHDCDKRGYIKKIVTEANTQKIAHFKEINVHSTSTILDINFSVGDYSVKPAKVIAEETTTTLVAPDGAFVTEKRGMDWRITSAVAQIEELYKSKEAGEQFNLAGTSAGSVVQAQAALILAEKGIVIDNLVLDGSPIPKDSELYKALQSNKNIKNIIRRDLPNDDVSEIGNKSFSIKWATLKKLLTSDDHPHFDVSRKEGGPKRLIEFLIKSGIK